MADIYLFNSLTRKKEKFTPINPPYVGMYTCGPTVYSYASIGNFRTYTLADILIRTLKYFEYKPKYVMNLTDVGHLTGDNLGDADIGEDRMEKAAAKEGKSAWDIAEYYAKIFLTDYDKLHLTKPDILCKATDHIKEQIDLIRRIEENGFTYKTSDGIYFDTKLYEENTGKKYGELSDLSDINIIARIEPNPEKRNPRDFALWKFSLKPGIRQMEWDSPWGLGFPGWHIECSAMSMKYLGESFDIHTGGEDLKQTHHPNEIAQSESATGKTFVNYWVHAAFLKVDGKRMGRSLGNIYRITDIEEKHIDPLALRYFYLTAHYKDPLNFTWNALEGAAKSLDNLKKQMLSFKKDSRSMLSEEKQEKIDKLRDKFNETILDDLNTPKALAVLWEVVKSNIPASDKYDLIVSYDQILGFNLSEVEEIVVEIPEDVKKFLEERNVLREKGEFSKADEKRKEIETRGFLVEDTNGKSNLKSIK